MPPSIARLASAGAPPLALNVSPAYRVGAQAVLIAERYLGVPYRWGGASPQSGFDCSGLTAYVYAQLGIPLTHYAATQWNETTHIDPSQLQPGDLVFFEPHVDGPGHVGIYIGADEFIAAPRTGETVSIQSLSGVAAALGFVGASRPYSPLQSAAPQGFAPPEQRPPTWLIARSKAAAGALGDPHPSSVRYLLGATDTIILKGAFRCAACAALSGSTAETGKVLIVGYNARTRREVTFAMRGFANLKR